jgi:o-succinylbenzoate synthase
MKAKYFPYQLQFAAAAGTSRGIMRTRDIYLIQLWDAENKEVFGIGECAPLKGLSIDDVSDYEEILSKVCDNIDYYLAHKEALRRYPSILFGIETAALDLLNGGKRILFSSKFTAGESTIAINGLIWMGTASDMCRQIENKIEQGFRVIKIKVGAIHFEEELAVLQWIRTQFKDEALEIRVDANGAFLPQEALDKLVTLAPYTIHSIEQPIQVGQQAAMRDLIADSPIAIALDEELIPVVELKDKRALLEDLKPQYIILKPSLHGGIIGCNEWIQLANELNIGWWITSALESNYGLNAIAQYTYSQQHPTTHGLGTGGLYTNNFKSPLFIQKGELHFDPHGSFDTPSFLTHV